MAVIEKRIKLKGSKGEEELVVLFDSGGNLNTTKSYTIQG